MRIGSLCSGYEGLGMAVQSVLGGELAWVADNDKGASKILAHRFPGVPNLGDITKVQWSSVEPPDILIAGFPCQDVSHAGVRRGLRKGTRSGIWANVALAVFELRPSLVILENVEGLLSAKADSHMEHCPWCLGDPEPKPALRALGAVLGDLAEIGLDAEWCCVAASEAGAPHRRRRVFAFAWPAADAERHGLEGRERGDRPDPVGPAEAGGGRGPARGDHEAAEDADLPAGGERRVPAPGQAPGRGARADSRGRGGAPAAHGDGPGLGEFPGVVPGAQGPGQGHVAVDSRGERADTDWGPYEPAIRRWEAVLGRAAPSPVEPGRTGVRLSPRFAEWMMGLDDGWVTAVPGLSRTDQLKALGNGVVRQQAQIAIEILAMMAPEALLFRHGQNNGQPGA